ncbi:MAG: metallophosphoesterase [bacterium]
MNIHTRSLACKRIGAATVLCVSLLTVTWARAGDAAPDRATDMRPFSLMVLPDTQVYSEQFPDVFFQQTQWVKDNCASNNCKFVIHEGDVVQTGPNEDQWKVADKAMSTLDGVVPYCFSPGNHDLPAKLFNTYFPVSRFERQPGFGGHYAKSNDNTYHFFSAAGLKFMIVALTFNPNELVYQWANDRVAEHPGCRVIVAVHSFDNNGAGLTPEGQRTWDNFAKKHKNIFLILSGHLSVGRQILTGDQGNTVYSVLADYQGLDNGGDGWLRILTFVPGEDVIRVTTYSTRLKKHFGPGDGRYSTPEMNAFDLPHKMK